MSTESKVQLTAKLRFPRVTALLFLCASISTIAGCKATPDSGSGAAELKLVWTLGDAEHRFGQVEEIATDENGNLYILDSEWADVLKFDNQGRLVKRSDGGDALSGKRVKGLAVTRGAVLVSEAFGRRISSFTRDLEYSRTTELDSTRPAPFTIGTGPDGELYVGTVSSEIQNKLMRFDSNFRFRSGSDLTKPSGQQLWDIFKFHVDNEGWAIVSYAFLPHIEICSPVGSSCTSFSVEQGTGSPPTFDEASIVNGFAIPPEKFFAWDVATDEQGHIYILSGEYALHPQRDVYVYDYDGRWLRTLILPNESKRLHVDRDGYLYVADTELTQVYKYDVTPDS